MARGRHPLLDLDPEGLISYTDPTFSWTHYTEVFRREPALRSVLRNTLVLAVWSTLFTVVLAYPAAYLLARLRRRLALPLLLLMHIPFWVSILVRLFTFTQVLGTKGLVNQAADLVNLGAVPAAVQHASHRHRDGQLRPCRT